MMKIQNNINLKTFNTFGFSVIAERFFELNNEQEIPNLLKEIQTQPYLILGGGSNLILTHSPIKQFVIKMNIQGIKVLKETDGYYLIRVGAGEIFDEFVQYCLTHHYYGLENLRAIPGTVGAAPIQNIGAYGVEIKSIIECVETIHVPSGEVKLFSNHECEFSYRNSIFKREEFKNNYIITHVIFKLNKTPNIQTNYADIQKVFNEKNIIHPTAQQIADCVYEIRKQKLPDPKRLGNVGSFFKNPEVTINKIEQLLIDYPQMPYFEHKLSAAWLIDQAGLKGFKLGDAGIHEKHALILVNYGNATGNDILKLAQFIQNKINELFQIHLEIEPTIF